MPIQIGTEFPESARTGRLLFDLGKTQSLFYWEKAMSEKRCFKCGEVKSIDDFYKHPQMADGHLGKCKECTKADVTENYHGKREFYAEYEKKRYQKESRRQSTFKYQRERRTKNPDKYKAHNMTCNAIRDGKLVRQPCEVCGTFPTQAHHDDYSKPLEIRWLCRKHHLEVHGKQAYEF